MVVQTRKVTAGDQIETRKEEEEKDGRLSAEGGGEEILPYL